MSLEIPANIPTSVEDINELFDAWYEDIQTNHVTHLTERDDNRIEFYWDLWDARQIPAVVSVLRLVGLSDPSSIVADYLNRSKWVDMALFSVPLESIVDVFLPDETTYMFKTVQRALFRMCGMAGTRNQLRRELVFFGRTDGGEFEMEIKTDVLQITKKVSGHFPLLFSDYTLRDTILNIRGSLNDRYLVGLVPQLFSFLHKKLIFPNIKEKLFTWNRKYGSHLYHFAKNRDWSSLPQGSYPLFFVQDQELHVMHEYFRELYEDNDPVGNPPVLPEFNVVGEM